MPPFLNGQMWPVGAIKSTKYPDQAYQLGKSVKKKA